LGIQVFLRSSVAIWALERGEGVARCNSSVPFGKTSGFIPGSTKPDVESETKRIALMRFDDFTKWEKLPCVLISIITCAWGFLGIIGETQAQNSTTSTGEFIYRVHCLRCHGETGDGRGPDSAALKVPPGDFHSPESTAKSELDLRAIIIWGLVFSPMHGWWDRLSSEEIREVISYIRQLAPYQPRI
jgi:mono/diheme cytochrome c family protein